MSKKYLKSIKTGRIFMHTDELQKRGDMVMCDVNGNVKEGETGVITTNQSEVRKSKYLGMMVNGKPGRLLFYSEQLATKPGVVSIDDPREWSGDISNVIPAKAPAKEKVVDKPKPAQDVEKDVEKDSPAPGSVSAPALSRDGGNPGDPEADTETDTEQQAAADISDSDQTEQLDQSHDDNGGEDTGLTVPDVSGISDEREKKGVLCKFAFDNFNVQMSRKFGVPRMIEECQALIDAGQAPA